MLSLHSFFYQAHNGLCWWFLVALWREPRERCSIKCGSCWLWRWPHSVVLCSFKLLSIGSACHCRSPFTNNQSYTARICKLSGSASRWRACGPSFVVATANCRLLQASRTESRRLCWHFGPQAAPIRKQWFCVNDESRVCWRSNRNCLNHVWLLRVNYGGWRQCNKEIRLVLAGDYSMLP